MTKASAPMSDAPPPYAVSAGDAPPPPGLYPNMSAVPPPVNPQYLPGYGQPPQQVMMQQQGPPPPQVAQVILTAGYGPHSMSTVCNACHQQVMTKTEPVTGLLTWILSCSMLALGCWLGCCLIPCCIRECQDIEHKCPSCKAHLGIYRRI